MRAVEFLSERKKKKKHRGNPIGGYYGYYWGGTNDNNDSGGDAGGESISENFINTLIEISQGPWTVMEAVGGVEVYTTNLLGPTLANKPKEIDARLKEFIKFKQDNPTAAWGKSDTLFVSDGPFAQAVPKLRHAHLNYDISVFYTIEGRDPTVLKIYGVFGHKESGTAKGNASQRTQKQLASQLKQAKI